MKRQGGFLEGSRKLIVAIVTYLMIMTAGYTMTVNADAVIMGLVGVATAFIGGNIMERKINHRRDNSYTNYEDEYRTNPGGNVLTEGD